MTLEKKAVLLSKHSSLKYVAPLGMATATAYLVTLNSNTDEMFTELCSKLTTFDNFVDISQVSETFSMT
jgi:hypothetical protein